MVLLTGWSGVRIPVGKRDFSSPHLRDRLCGPCNHPYNGYRVSFPGVKRSERDGSRLPPSDANRMSVAMLSAGVSTNCDTRNTSVPREDMCSVKRIDEKQKNNTDLSVNFVCSLFDHSLRY